MNQKGFLKQNSMACNPELSGTTNTKFFSYVDSQQHFTDPPRVLGQEIRTQPATTAVSGCV
eukprot:m.430646 g.430646  ORF g.430646 m.430646 type:complete len:61 (-) comp17193_c0_seq1:826-1008(-)